MDKEILMVPKHIGMISVGNTIDIADPGMDRGTYPTLPVVSGEYFCKVYIGGNKPDRTVWITQIVNKEHFGKGKLGVQEISVDENWERVATVNVYCGLAGFFNNKPDFPEKTWKAMCDKYAESNHSIHMLKYFEKDKLGDYGFFASSGLGDGEYPVYAIKRYGKIVALEIRFFEEKKEN